MDAGGIIAIIVGLGGLSGCVFTGLSWRRSDTTAVVGQQSTVLHDMADLNEELRKTNQDLKSEVAALREQVQRLTHER